MAKAPEDPFGTFRIPPKKPSPGATQGKETGSTLPIWVTAGPGGEEAFIVGFSFPDVESTRFARLALEEALVTRDDVKACFDRIDALREQGVAKSLAEIMQEEGLITAKQARTIAAKVSQADTAGEADGDESRE
jgi:hypothetical protein